MGGGEAGLGGEGGFAGVGGGGAAAGCESMRGGGESGEVDVVGGIDFLGAILGEEIENTS